jgi:hypothetical protein
MLLMLLDHFSTFELYNFLWQLEIDLEDFHGCFYEDGPEACQKEIDVSTHDLFFLYPTAPQFC